MKQPVDHIERPRLPWRPESDIALTECGFEAVKVKCLTRSEFFRRLKEYGEQRTAILTCMTCIDTARRWSTWEEDPRSAIEREVLWERRQFDNPGNKLRNELRAIDLLIKAHPEEFRSLVNDIGGIVDFMAEKKKRR